jgi:hypothetical protein
MSNEGIRTGQVMAAKANKKSDIYTPKEVSKLKAASARKAKMKK